MVELLLAASLLVVLVVAVVVVRRLAGERDGLRERNRTLEGELDRLTAVDAAAGDDLAAQVAAVRRGADEVRRLQHHLAWVTAVDVHGPLRQNLDDLRSLRRTRLEVMEIGERHLVDGAIDRTEEVLTLLADLRAWATMPVQRLEDPAVVDLREALDRAVAALDHGDRATLDVAPLPRVRGDLGLLSDAFHAALDNCVRYRWPDAPVRITVDALPPVDGRVLVRIVDDGAGVDPDGSDRLFLPFTRGASSAARAGVGMGLATVRAAVRAMGGDARFLPHEGRGSTLGLELPAA